MQARPIPQQSLADSPRRMPLLECPLNQGHPGGAVMTQNVIASNPVTAFWRTIIGKKVVMGITGVVLVAFVIAHMLGNLKIFLGAEAIDTYAGFLRTMGEPLFPYSVLLWVVRIVLLSCVGLHITAAVQLTRMSWAARPIDYAIKRNIKSTFATRMMRWGGLLLVAFLIFHLLHLTAGVVGFGAGQFKHLAVHQNVLAAFAVWSVALLYIVAMGALYLHLDHGIWSVLQTLGWSTARNEKNLKILSRVIAIVVSIGFISVPVAVTAGWLR